MDLNKQMTVNQNPRLRFFLEKALRGDGGITVLTGAGISAESGVPTFRGPEGYWTVGSQVYQPQEMATHAMFRQNPRAVWQWYLYRLGVCQAASPNAGHLALVAMEKVLKERFTLITQNVDNLHLVAGQRPERTFQIHGNLTYVRCSDECRRALMPLPPGLTAKTRNEPIDEIQWRQLACPACGALLRPHVLWLDEYYDEHYFRMQSALSAAARTALLIVVGTAGATNLPNQIVSLVHNNNGMIIDINTTDNPFGRLADGSARGIAIREPAGKALPDIARIVADIMAAQA